jgi:hypothetical protein
LVSGFKFQVSSFRFQVSGFRFQVSGFRFQVSSEVQNYNFNFFEPQKKPKKVKELTLVTFVPFMVENKYI